MSRSISRSPGAHPGLRALKGDEEVALYVLLRKGKLGIGWAPLSRMCAISSLMRVSTSIMDSCDVDVDIPNVPASW